VQVGVPFGERLAQLLSARKPESGQAWLAKVSGLEASTISRLLRGDRLPARQTLEVLAPALGVSIEELIVGTTAAERMSDGPEFVGIDQFRELVEKMLASERRADDAEAQAKRYREVYEESAPLARAAKEAEARAQLLEKERMRLESEVRRYRDALDKAVADLCGLNAQLTELKRAANATEKTSALAAVLAGIAAAGGILTAASYLDKDDAKPAKKPKAEKKRTAT
jgi:transcriptional regulator with XRE-family HTH domain